MVHCQACNSSVHGLLPFASTVRLMWYVLYFTENNMLLKTHTYCCSLMCTFSTDVAITRSCHIFLRFHGILYFQQRTRDQERQIGWRNSLYIYRHYTIATGKEPILEAKRLFHLLMRCLSGWRLGRSARNGWHCIQCHWIKGKIPALYV